MIELEQEQNRKTRCLLVGDPGDDLRELRGLTDTLGMETAGEVTLRRLEMHPAYGTGRGKAEEIADAAREAGADCIIFDFNLDPTKQRNWEKLSGIPCFDRQEVIIRIFAQRAQTKEAVLQVELARLNYSLSRLAHSYGEMARQRGGSYGAKGAGETQLALDRRRVRERIFRTKKELEGVVRTRETQRKKRGGKPLPECALVGYTNAGKSSLLNALTGADAFVEDKLFATLDPLTRRLRAKGGGGILLTDTVGFISNLPHGLIEAFKSTLSEARRADLLLVVIDASDPCAEEQYRTVLDVLEEIGADGGARLVVLNKTDLTGEADIRLLNLRRLFPKAVCVSAKTGAGLDRLSGEIVRRLSGSLHRYLIPADRSDILSEIRKAGSVSEEAWLDDGVHVTARVSGRVFETARPYLVQET